MLNGFDRAVIVDAMQANPKSRPGTLTRMSLQDLSAHSPTQHTASAHDTTLPTAIRCGRHLGMKVPDDIIIFAIEVRNITDFGEQLTPEVANCIPEVASEVMTAIRAGKRQRLGKSNRIVKTEGG
jgi:hydrogenase maturation protease